MKRTWTIIGVADVPQSFIRTLPVQLRTLGVKYGQYPRP
jgi:hypothetical protein